MNLVIGRKYVVKPGFDKMRRLDDPGISYGMLEFAGKELTIKSNASNANWYKVHENTWTWDSSWLEECTEMEDIQVNDLMKLFE